MLSDIDVKLKDKIFNDDTIELNLFLDALRAECVRRLKFYKVSKDKFISLLNEHFLNVLKFGEVWRFLEKCKKKNSFTFFWSTIPEIQKQEEVFKDLNISPRKGL